MTMACGTAADLFDEADETAVRFMGGLALAKRIAAAAVRLALATLFVVAGVMKLIPTEFEVNAFRHFGYALWFMYVIGAVELAGGLMLLAPSLAALGRGGHDAGHGSAQRSAI
jgi:uncharacterized membrane protein YphA (DoxX/SURF4 family)